MQKQQTVLTNLALGIALHLAKAVQSALLSEVVQAPREANYRVTTQIATDMLAVEGLNALSQMQASELIRALNDRNSVRSAAAS